MGRPRVFDEDAVTEAAMRAFWRAGYEAVSTDDLCAATGLGRSSIYNTFKSKHELFLAALRRYAERQTGWLAELMGRPLPAREKVRAVLARAIEPEGDDPSGCLVVNSAVELSPRDPEVTALIQRDQERRVQLMRAAFEAARRSGELGADRDPLALAHFVAATVSGMRVAARTGADRATLETIAATALRAI